MSSTRFWSSHWHAVAVVTGVLLLMSWVFARPLFQGLYLSESDLYDYFLPVFLSPTTIWSSFEFGGLPAFADPGDTSPYPPFFVFARLVGSWAGFAVSAYVLGTCFTYAYVFSLTRSRSAALFSGLSFGLSEALVERLPHMGILHAIGWLPLIVLALDKLRGPRPLLWMAVGAFAFGNCILAGHPQPAVYMAYVCVLYAIVGGRAERARPFYFLLACGVFVFGGMLAAVKLVPLVEASSLMARQLVPFGAFVGHANSPTQMWSALFPTILHEGREAPTYVGLATLLFAVVGVVDGRRQWRILFWTAATLFAVFLGLGSHTPVADLAYHIPLYDKFRASPRHLLIAAFGAAVLAGLGLDAVRRGRVSRRLLVSGIVSLGVVTAVGAAYIASAPTDLVFEPRNPIHWGLPSVLNDAVWTQLVFAAATMALALAVRRFARSQIWVAALLVLLCADLLNSAPYDLTPLGLDWGTITADELTPSVHAKQLQKDLAPAHQRFLAPGGTQTDAIVPGAFARLWQIPSAGGYGPLLLARHAMLATMGNNGSVTDAVLSPADVSLDLLAVRTIIVQPENILSRGSFEREGVSWEKRPFDLSIGRADCGYNYPRNLSIALHDAPEVTEIAIVGYLRCAEDVEQGTQVATVSVVGADGRVFERPLHAGVDIADAALALPEVRERAKHRPARRFDDPDAGNKCAYVLHFALPQSMQANRIEIRANVARGWMVLDRLTIIDGRGKSVPQRIPQIFLSDQTRWRETKRLRTSRVSDRAVDVDAPEDQPFILYENLRARPRAWIVSSVVGLSEHDMVQTIRTSQLPDGRPFEPGNTALLDVGTGPTQRSFPTGASAVNIDEIVDGRISMTVATEAGGYLVLSEASYPGWRARVDGKPTTIYRTNLSLQGIVVPAGGHRVVFEFAPTSLYVGASLSVLTLISILMLGACGLIHRRARSR